MRSGIEGYSFAASKIVGWIYSVIAVGVTIWAAFPPVWLLTLLAAVTAPVARTLALALLGWAALSIYWPMDQGLDPRSLALLILAPQTATIAVTILALRRSTLAVKSLQSGLDPCPIPVAVRAAPEQQPAHVAAPRQVGFSRPSLARALNRWHGPAVQSAPRRRHLLPEPPPREESHEKALGR